MMKTLFIPALLILSIFSTAAATLSACGEAEVKNTPFDLPPEANNRDLPRARFGNLNTSSFDVTNFDLNADGIPDQIHYLSGGALSRIERDLNFDGVPDIYEHYKNSALIEEELDLDLDGSVDVIRIYDNDVVRQKQYATDFSSTLPIVRWYDPSGSLIRIERDSDADGITDTWEHYNPGSNRPFKIEIDTNGDGTPDRTIS